MAKRIFRMVVEKPAIMIGGGIIRTLYTGRKRRGAVIEWTRAPASRPDVQYQINQQEVPVAVRDAARLHFGL